MLENVPFEKSKITTNVTWEYLVQNARVNGVKDDLHILWFADAEHNWYCRSHYIFVKWWEKTYPVCLNVIKYYFENMPFLLVWLMGVFLWFFIELTNSSAEFFNLKHTYTFYKSNFLYYGVAIKKLGVIFIKNIWLKLIYKQNL